ncbi:DsrH/TusB family sulfur metabolism protein [Catenovulum sediminis]|uniref:DsrH/TusB family sulfur metabolism protein n=1 Tax=Catenovulum sediminis TaxID=1740262 RepID=A0ABV1RHP0_9ALTE|nr:DsrH/TusB family sulfur metabolism protein [Catenovulum sediminis]
MPSLILINRLISQAEFELLTVQAEQGLDILLALEGCYNILKFEALAELSHVYIHATDASARGIQKIPGNINQISQSEWVELKLSRKCIIPF